jgi:RNA recognition motif-containing protein
LIYYTYNDGGLLKSGGINRAKLGSFFLRNRVSYGVERAACFYLHGKPRNEARRIRRSRMQGSKLYVGNLSYSVTSDELKELFSGMGEVREVKVIEGKGFGFVEMGNQADAEKAKKELNGTQFMGRTITVDEARPQKDKPRRGGSRRY